MPAEGRNRDRIPRAVLSFNARVAREVDAGSCEQGGLRQSVAGIAVVEKNRCIRISAPNAWSGALGRQSSGLAGTTISGDSRAALNRLARLRIFLAHVRESSTIATGSKWTRTLT